jgi:geranylgeranyl diphosphate synthase type I
VDHAGVRAAVGQAITGFLRVQRDRLVGIDGSLADACDAIEAFVRGGKRLRSSFGYWGFVAAGGQPTTEVIAALAALEFVQASALIHDDVMDGSDTRRGEPSVHRRFAAHHAAAGWTGSADGFGTAAAILLGDLCLCWSDEMLHTSGVEVAALTRARPVFDRMRTEVTAGQYLDVLTQVTGHTSVERAGKVARYKSAKYTVERPLLFGSAMAGGDDVVNKALSGYGLPLGEAFQLRDDILGVFGDPGVTGKPAGDDLREGKRTFLVAAAVETGTDHERRLLFDGLGDPDLPPARIDAIRGIIVATGALKRTENRIADLTEEALSSLGSAPLHGQAATALTELAIAATRRDV